MLKTNKDIFRASAELYHRLIETKEIDIKEAKAGAALLSVCQKSLMIEIMEINMGKTLQIEAEKEEGKMFVKRVK